MNAPNDWPALPCSVTSNVSGSAPVVAEALGDDVAQARAERPIAIADLIIQLNAVAQIQRRPRIAEQLLAQRRLARHAIGFAHVAARHAGGRDEQQLAEIELQSRA